MRSTVRFVLCGAAFALAFAFPRFELRARAFTELAQFGGAVLVGDGEVFAGESNNQFRPGIVYGGSRGIVGAMFAMTAEKGHVVWPGSGDQTWCMVHRDDLAVLT